MMSEKSRDRELSDIAAYYENTDIAADITADNTDDAKTEDKTTEKTQVFEAAADTSPKQESEPVLLNELIPKKKLPMTAWAEIGALAVVLSAFIIGRFVLPVSDLKIMGHRARLQETDKAYLGAKTENAKLNAEISELEKDNKDIENTFNDVVEYKKTYDALKAEYKEKQDKTAGLDKQLQSLEKELSDLNDELEKYQNKTYVLGAGIYTVGTHLPTGEYNISGTGTFLLASKNNALKSNSRLDTDGDLFTLSDGDIIKLDDEARFVREGG